MREVQHEALKPALQALLISPNAEVRQRIVSGEITATIREGARDYRNGRVGIFCHLEPWAVMAVITDVKHCSIKEISGHELAQAGYRSEAEVLADLKIPYPGINRDSMITFIKFEDVQGKSVDLMKQRRTT